MGRQDARYFARMDVSAGRSSVRTPCHPTELPKKVRRFCPIGIDTCIDTVHYGYMKNTERQSCSRKGCTDTAEHTLIGAARLCLVHWLRRNYR